MEINVLSAVFIMLSPQKNDGFVPIDTGSLAAVSGKNFMIVAYAAFFAVLVIYAVSLVWREKKIQRRIREVEKRM
jgi:hypothetical protein